MKPILRLSLALAALALGACAADTAPRSSSGGGGGGGGTERDTGSTETDTTTTPEEDTEQADTGSAPDEDTSVVLDVDLQDTTGGGDTGTRDTSTPDTIAPGICAADGDACTGDGDSTEEFLCLDDGTGELFCRTRCDSDRADSTASADCPLNSWCLESGDTSTALLGACIPGDCATNIFDAAACDGTGTCLPVGNGASFCIDAGDAGVGDPCNVSTAATPPASDVCATGLLCLNNLCVAPCNRANGNNDCGSGDTCLAAFDSTARNRPGVCGDGCAAFSSGACGAGRACEPILGRSGVNVWMCRDQVGTTEFAAGEICDDTGHCSEGYLCLASGETTAGGEDILRCTEICNPQDQVDGLPVCHGDVCGPSAIDGLGICAQGCTPFPRQPSGDYGCNVTDGGCLPVVAVDTEPTEPYGTCQAGDAGTVAAYAGCSESGFFGECADLALCFDTSDDSTDNPDCQPLCPPLTHDASICGARATCSPLLPLLGNLAFGTCDPHPTPGTVGGTCAAAGSPCDADGTLCIDAGSGPVCVAVCREGFSEDCAIDPGTTCRVGLFDATVVPSFMGVCQ